MSEPVRFFNRYTNKIEQEEIYGEGPLRFAYENPMGRFFLETLVKRGFFSRMYGWRMDQPASRARIECFIKRYGLDVSEFLDDPSTYRSFNEFFYRKLKPEARPLHGGEETIVFPADGRHLGFARASEISGVFVKGQKFDLPALLGDAALAERYAAGTLVLSRLCPVDYHRYHLPCAGIPGVPRIINGPLYSVSPVALRRRLDYLWENKRALTTLDAGPLGTVLLLEIGATNVGSIVHTITPGVPAARGAEKGYFQFGGSSTITIFEPGKVILAEDLARHSAGMVELYARVGDVMATAAATVQ